MFESELYVIKERVSLMPSDRNKCAFIADMIVIQCIVVFIGSASILSCFWSPDEMKYDYAKLTCIMYLYDSEACGYKLTVEKLIVNLHISNETFGLQIRPIKWLPAIITVSTRLSVKTRRYIEMSCAIHAIWFILAVTFRIFIKNSSDIRTLKAALTIFFYSCIFVIGFDLSMAVVYITHIKQSLTKGMILRYSGWSTALKLKSYDDFAGWLPIAAAICWMRGFIIFFLNLYFCKVLNTISRKIKTREFRRKFPNERFEPIPEAQQIQANDDRVLIYRVGEKMPHRRETHFF